MSKLKKSAGDIIQLMVWLFFTSEMMGSPEEMKLKQDMLLNYSRFLKPNPISGFGPTTVQLALRLEQIFELEEKTQVLSASVYIIQSWIDGRLIWKPSDYKGIEEISFSSDEIWVSDLVLINNAAKAYSGRNLGMSSPIHVKHDGKAVRYSNVLLKSYCKLKVRYFPFDEQFCPLHIASWSYIGSELYLVEASDINNILQNYTENSAWRMVEAYYINSSVVDRNFPSIPKATVTYFFHLQRNVFYYFVYLFAPCMLTSLLMTLIFLAPPECGERMVIGVTSLLALTVFFMLAAKNIPETSEDVPLMGRYYSLSIVIMSIALVATALVLRVHHASSEVPWWVKMYVLGYLAHFLRIDTPQNTNDKAGRFTKQEIMVRQADEKTDSVVNDVDDNCGLSMMAARVFATSLESTNQDEWRLAAKIVNRLFLILYMLSILASVMGIFMQIPGLIISRPAKPLSFYSA